MKEKNTAKKLADAISSVQARVAAKGTFNSPDVAKAVIKQLSTETPDEWAAIRDELVWGSITRAVRKRIDKSIEADDSRQGWLALPEFEHIPQFIKIGSGWIDVNQSSLEQFQMAKSALKSRMESYDYARRSEKKAKADRKRLKEMERTEQSTAKYFAADPTITMGRAMELLQATLEPISKGKAVAAKKGGTK
jgi:hypothetical protein